MTTGLGTSSGVVTAPVPKLVPHPVPSPMRAVVQVLVFEDDADQRDLIAIHLRRAGCAVYPTGRVDEAAETVGRVALDLAILDMDVPGGAGATTAALLRRHHPACSVVLSSVLDRDAFPSVADVLTKPFSRAEVLRFVPRPAPTFIPAPRSGAGR